MEDFDLIYNKIYQENYDFLEKLRKNSKQAYVNLYGLLVLFIIELILIKFNIGYAVLFLLVGFISIINLIFKSSKMFKEENTYHEEYKKRIINSLIDFYDKDLKYSYNDGISYDDYMYGLLNNERYKSNNLIEKQLNDTLIRASQVVIEKLETVDGQTSVVKILFSGIFVKITYNDPNKKIDFLEDKKNKIKKICSTGPFKFDVEIDQTSIYIRFYCGNIFEKNILKSSLNKKTLYNSYCTIKSVFDISTEIVNKILI